MADAVTTQRRVINRTLLNTAIVTGGALLSRVLGLGRDIAINRQFGAANPDYDTYLLAFRVPDFLYIVIAGGALATTLIPVFQQVWHEEGEQRAWQVVSAVVNLVLIVLAVAALLIMLLATPLSHFFFATKPESQQQMLAAMMRLFILSSPLLLGLGGLAMAVLNARDRFGWTAAAFNLYNLAIIAGAVFLVPRYGIWGVATGVVVGALLYLLILLPGLWAEHATYVPRLGLYDPAVRRVGRQLVPRLVGQSAAQIGVLATGFFAARLPGDQYARLNIANQLMLLPHGVFVISLVTVMFPQLARLWSQRERDQFSTTAIQTVRLVLFVSAPIAVAIGVLRVPIIRLLYERGNFTAQSTAFVATPLLVFATALVAFAISEPLVRTFYAMQDTRTPVIVGVATILLNIAVGYLVIHFTDWQASGLAFAFSLANNIEAVTLLVLLAPRLTGLNRLDFLQSVVGVAASAGVMGFAIWGFRRLSVAYLPSLALTGSYGRSADALRLLLWLAVSAVLGSVVYLGVATVLRIAEVDQAVTLIRRRRGNQTTVQP